MREDTGVLKAGMAVVFSHGEYSDYGFGEVYIVAQDFNYMDEAKEHAFEYMEKEYAELENKNNFWVSGYDLYQTFESYLIRKGFLVLCQNREVHTGDYDFFDEKWIDDFKTEKGIVDD